MELLNGLLWCVFCLSCSLCTCFMTVVARANLKLLFIVSSFVSALRHGNVPTCYVFLDSIQFFGTFNWGLYEIYKFPSLFINNLCFYDLNISEGRQSQLLKWVFDFSPTKIYETRQKSKSGSWLDKRFIELFSEQLTKERHQGTRKTTRLITMDFGW